MLFNIFKKEKSEWEFDRKVLAKKRKMGISGIMRLRNEEDYVGLAIESHLPFLDELIIIYNRCTDRTPEISWEYQKKFPEKIKVFKYEPYVYPQGSKQHKKLSYKSIHSMGNYSNYALSKANFAYAIRVYVVKDSRTAGGLI